MSPVATKKKPKRALKPEPGDTMALVDAAVDEQTKLENAAFEICMASDDPRTLGGGELAVVQRHLGSDSHHTVDAFWRQCQSVRRRMVEAGSSRDYTDANTVHRDASASLAKERPAIEAEVAALQQRLRSLEDAQRSARQRVELYDRARDSLRDERSLPRWAWKSFQNRLRALRAGELGVTKRDLESRVQHLEAVVGLEVTTAVHTLSPKLAIQYCESHAPECLRRRHGAYTLDVDKFKAHKAEKQRELDALRPELAKATAEYERADRECREPLEHWVSQL